MAQLAWHGVRLERWRDETMFDLNIGAVVKLYFDAREGWVCHVWFNDFNGPATWYSRTGQVQP